MTTIRERLRDRAPVYQPTLADAHAIRRWFEEHPFSNDAYYFADGRFVDGERYRARCARINTCYAGSLVLMASDGIPVNVTRRHAEFYLRLWPRLLRDA